MLSNLASYLLGGYGEASSASAATPSSSMHRGGGSQPAVLEPISAALVPNQRLISETEDDDWVVVSKPGEELSDGESNIVPVAGATNGMEESWFVTPPPCFSSTGPVSVETSPLENLLIEHPSMSVYRRRSPSRGGSPVTMLPASPAVAAAIVQLPMVRGGVPDQENAVRNPTRHHATAARQQPVHQPVHRHRHPLQQIVQQQAKFHASQKQEAKRNTDLLKGSHLDKDNKVREVNGRNRRQRRSDMQKKHSGANNNRKC